MGQNAQNEAHSLTLDHCPDGGSCKISVIKNKELHLKTDEFGMNYPEIIEGENYIFEYIFSKNTDYADGNYKEIVLFELPKNEISLLLQDENLQKVNLLYGRLCYCKGESGYEKVLRGKLDLKRNNSEVIIKLEFNTDLPQVIKTIEEVIILP
ncbi:hypothetical protein ACFQ39_02935 [Namhaeicola litoreus]|uniref:Uncharacterized protein n=1 Tax=Namhaeicola litoreus TaxID=1052145 RepID=A0ABW3XY88_9FLAO